MQRQAKDNVDVCIDWEKEGRKEGRRQRSDETEGGRMNKEETRWRDKSQ